MTLAAFQRVQTCMVADPVRSRAVARGDFGADADQLDEIEKGRLVRQASHPGFTLTRKLHEGWRLTKLLTLLPTTFAADDQGELADLVLDFWSRRMPNSLYFEEEARDFARVVAAGAKSDVLRAAAELDLTRLSGVDPPRSAP